MPCLSIANRHVGERRTNLPLNPFGSGPKAVPALAQIYATREIGDTLKRTSRRENYPRPTNGILVAMTVIVGTFTSSGRLAM